MAKSGASEIAMISFEAARWCSDVCIDGGRDCFLWVELINPVLVHLLHNAKAGV